MKIQVVSDLHLEFAPVTVENAGNTDVLILSGDICVAQHLRDRDPYNAVGEHDKSNQFHTFFQECCARFPHVVYVMGNHEHYNGDFSNSIGILRERLGYLANLHILDKQSVTIDDVVFVGGTLWTDMNKEDPTTLYTIRGVMNDYRIVRDSGMGGSSRFIPETSVADHKAMLQFISDTVSQLPKDAKVVVVGHHAPSKQSTKPRYEKEFIMNGAYSSDLSEFILDRPQIKLWTHGHTHEEFDYMVGSTRIFCNPRGYEGYEHRADVFDAKLVVEV